MSSGEQNSVLQTTKNLIGSVQQIIFISPPTTRCYQPIPCSSSRPTTMSSHLESRPSPAKYALGLTRGGKEAFGGGDGEHFLAFGRQRHLPISLQHAKLPKACRPPQVGHLRLLVWHDTRCFLPSQRRTSPRSLHITKHQPERDQGLNACRQSCSLDR